MRRLVKFLASDSGTTSVEYCLMLGFILTVVIGSVAAFGQSENGTWLGIGQQMVSHGM